MFRAAYRVTGNDRTLKTSWQTVFVRLLRARPDAAAMGNVEGIYGAQP